MLEKPDIKEEILISCLQEQFDLQIGEIAFMPLGADQNTAVYRAADQDETRYFVKLRRGEFNPLNVTIPNHLHAQGMRQVIPVVCTQSGQFWADLGEYKLILYPFIEGHHGYHQKMTAEHWAEFGRALKQLHSANQLPEIMADLRREAFSAQWGQLVKRHLEDVKSNNYADPVARELAAFLRANADLTTVLINRAAQLVQDLRKHPRDVVLCHGDIHGWNLLITANNQLFIVDWDTLVLAPKERDLMFIGGGIGNSGHTPPEETALFYRGYGKTDVDQNAIAYYRCERILEDIAIYCDQILLSDEGGMDREQSLLNLMSNYLPGSTIELAAQN